MRAMALGVLATGMLLASGAAYAQTYAPGYPVCLKVYGPTTYNECLYTTMAQCNASASGRSAQCYPNPHFANAEVSPARHRRHNPAY
jgi:hypothetical protein